MEIEQEIFYRKLAHFNPEKFPKGIKNACIRAMQEYSEKQNATLQAELEKAKEQIAEIQRRYDVIMSEPNGMVRDTMIGSLFIGF